MASLEKKVAWRTTSKARLKSRLITWTNGSVSSIVVMVCMRVMLAAVVNPVGRKANWLAVESARGGMLKAG